jgi:hypothetical protein
MKQKKIPYGTKLPVKLTLHERDIIHDQTFCDPNYTRLAVVDGKGIKVNLSLDEIEDIQGYVAAEANHTKNKVPYVEDEEEIFLKTIIPRRKATEIYFGGKNEN